MRKYIQKTFDFLIFKKAGLFFTLWWQNSALSPYSVKWQGYFFSLLLATELAPRGKEVPKAERILDAYRFRSAPNLFFN